MELNITEIQRLELKPTEILVLYIPASVPDEARERFGNRLEKMFSDAGYDFKPQILILDENISLEIIEKGKKKPQKKEPKDA